MSELAYRARYLLNAHPAVYMPLNRLRHRGGTSTSSAATPSSCWRASPAPPTPSCGWRSARPSPGRCGSPTTRTLRRRSSRPSAGTSPRSSSSATRPTRSWHTWRSTSVSARTALVAWIRYHRRIMTVREGFVAAGFDEVTHDFGAVAAPGQPGVRHELRRVRAHRRQRGPRVRRDQRAQPHTVRRSDDARARAHPRPSHRRARRAQGRDAPPSSTPARWLRCEPAPTSCTGSSSARRLRRNHAVNNAGPGVIPWNPASWMAAREDPHRSSGATAIPPALVFVGGLHRSGTSLVHRCLALHPAVSGFSGTGVPEDEGQHLQTVYPAGLPPWRRRPVRAHTRGAAHRALAARLGPEPRPPDRRMGPPLAARRGGRRREIAAEHRAHALPAGAVPERDVRHRGAPPGRRRRRHSEGPQAAPGLRAARAPLGRLPHDPRPRRPARPQPPDRALRAPRRRPDRRARPRVRVGLTHAAAALRARPAGPKRRILRPLAARAATAARSPAGKPTSTASATAWSTSTAPTTPPCPGCADSPDLE